MSDTQMDKNAEYGFAINAAKTKFMVLSKNGNMQCKIQLDNTTIEQVESFNYLGVYITSDGRCAKEIRYRIYVVAILLTKRENFSKTAKLA